MMKTKKNFDCVEMKHRGAERIREQTAGMTKAQLLEFWQKRSQVLRERQQRLIRQSRESEVLSRIV